MIQFIPISVSMFGITVKFILPSSKLAAFIIGVVFWLFFGPIVRWAIGRTARMIATQRYIGPY